jgi:hypothetical protein
LLKQEKSNDNNDRKKASADDGKREKAAIPVDESQAPARWQSCVTVLLDTYLILLLKW